MNKKDTVVLSLENIAHGWTTGFNQTAGTSGLVPLYAFDPPAVYLDFGTTSMRTAYFKDKTSSILRSNRVVIGPQGPVFGADSGEVSVKGFKRWVSLPYPNILMDKYFQTCNLSIIDHNHSIGFKSYDSVTKIHQILGELFATIWRDANAQMGFHPTILVIAIPFVWNYYQRQLVHECALMSGFEKVKLVDQTTALGYEIQTLQEKAAIISLGASVTEISITIGTENVLGTVGDEEFGGNDYTLAIFEHIKREIGIDELNAAQNRQLYNECETAKLLLEDYPAVLIPTPQGDFKLDRTMLAKTCLPLQQYFLFNS